MVPSIDLVALDLDGTLLTPQDDVSPANRRAIRDAIDAGVRVAIVTGRGLDSPQRLVRDLQLNLPAICAHGALTKDFLAGRTLGHIPVPLAHAHAMLAFSDEQKLRAAAYHDERFLYRAGMELSMEDMLPPAWVAVPSLAAAVGSAPTFLRFFGRDSIAAIRDRFGDLPLHFKHESFGDHEELAVTNAEATKQHALAQLCEAYGVPPERVMAIGDSRNDVPMLQWAGIGVAMGNALPEVRAAVEHVTAPYDRDGVAEAIERFVLHPAAARAKSA
jgi:hydroxymethylpyrimidine pyrophosphatase-like HAD family hydrolase